LAGETQFWRKMDDETDMDKKIAVLALAAVLAGCAMPSTF
jgi:hypothetical protein